MGSSFIRGCTYIGIFSLLLLVIVGNVTGQKQLDTDNIKESVSYNFCYETDSYRYTLDSDYKESFDFVTEEGNYLSTFAGGGSFLLEEADSRGYNVKQKVSSYKETKQDGITSLRIDYEMQDESNAYNIYTFYEQYVEVKAVMENISSDFHIAGAMLKRDMQENYMEAEKKIATSWVYPENGDFPYKQTDAIVTTYLFENDYKLYSFVRGEEAQRAVLFEEYDEIDILLPVNDVGINSYELTYHLVFENTKNGRDADCYALFEGKNSDFAAKIDVYEKNGSNVAIYEKDEIEIGLKITNLMKTANATKVTYNVHAYDGETVCYGETIVSMQGQEEQEIPIVVKSEKNGIFYLDFQVESEQNSYRELFSFALTEPYDYQYTGENPFGLSGVRFGRYEPNDDTIWSMNKLGISNVRICFSEGDYVEKDYSLLIDNLKKLRKNGMKINGQYLLLSGWRMPDTNTIDEFTEELDKALNQVAPYLDSCEMGNEYNLYREDMDVSQAMDEYMQVYFESGYELISQKYNKEIAGAGVGLSKADWLEESVHVGLYERQDVLKTHAYGFPHSPDYTADQELDLVVESALARTRTFLEQNGDTYWCVDEIGYPTTANENSGTGSGVSLRSQADYIVRAMALGLGYGADQIAIYNLYDQQNLFQGVSDTNKELNFGIFYARDYYGRILPKPSAVAVKNVTTILDGVSYAKEVETSKATVRAFAFYNTKDELMSYVAWSNCAGLSNDKADGAVRTPNLPWENEWKETESYRFFVSVDSAEIVDIMGNTEEICMTDGYVDIELNGSPKFIKVRNK